MTMLLTQLPLSKIIEGKMGKEILAGIDEKVGSSLEDSRLSEQEHSSSLSNLYRTCESISESYQHC
jgi:hypothetical protein